MKDTIKLFCCDFNWSWMEEPRKAVVPSAPQDWAEVDPVEYFDWHREFGCNIVFCQAYTFGGYAFYPTALGPTAPHPGSQLFARLYDLGRSAGMPVCSYFCVGADLVMSSCRDPWVIPTSRGNGYRGFLAPESPWTDLLCRRIQEFLHRFPVDWLLFDWFVYGSLKPDFLVQPAWFVERPLQEIIGKPVPENPGDITPEESLIYKREVLARQFRRIRSAVKDSSPETKIMFNVPYWMPREDLWVDHPMMAESDGLFAECSRQDVVEWLLDVRSPHQRVMTTVIGRLESGECEPASWRRWVDRGCDLFGYAWGVPPDFRPDPSGQAELAIVRDAFAQIP